MKHLKTTVAAAAVALSATGAFADVNLNNVVVASPSEAEATFDTQHCMESGTIASVLIAFKEVSILDNEIQKQRDSGIPEYRIELPENLPVVGYKTTDSDGNAIIVTHCPSAP